MCGLDLVWHCNPPASAFLLLQLQVCVENVALGNHSGAYDSRSEFGRKLV